MSSMDRSRTPSRRGHHRDSRSPTTRRKQNHHDSGTSRTRGNSYSDDTYSDYSDSFYTEDESDRRSGRGRGGRGRSINNKTVPRGRGKPIAGRNSKAQGSPRGIDYVTKRMLSARRMKINELRCESETLHQQLIDLKKENKMLLKQQRVSDRQLDRYEGQEYDLPALLQRHSEEVRALKEQLRKQREKYQKTDRKLRETEDELQRTRRLVKKMRGLVDDKQLKERDELSQKLSKQEAELDDSNHRLQQLERHTENLSKNHRHELGIERARHKETASKLQEAEGERQRLLAALREKEKELDIKNIYSNRILRPPHKLNSSVSSSPMPDTGRPPRSHRRKNSTPGSITPREKAKLYEDQRRDDMRRAREHPRKNQGVSPRRQKEKLDLIKDTYKLKTDTKSRKSDTKSQKYNTKSRRSKHENSEASNGEIEASGNNITPKDSLDDKNTTFSFNFRSHDKKETKHKRAEGHRAGRRHDNNKMDDDEDFTYNPTWTRGENDKREHAVDKQRIQQLREEEEQIRRQAALEEQESKERILAAEKRREAERQAELDRKNSERSLREDGTHRREEERLAMQSQREEDDRQDELEKERRERLAQENAEREKRQREERERKEREERERREQEKKEQEEQERGAREEQNRLENDAAERERRKQKDLLLARMRVIDESRMEENDPFLVPGTSKSDKKEYGFTQPIENMHNGKPAYDNVKVPVLERTRKKGFFDDDDDVGGYQPSFTGTKGSGKQRSKNILDTDSESGSAQGKRKPAKPDQKSHLMDSLFGSSSSKQNNGSPQKERSSTALFGGGNAIVDDDEAPPRSNAHLLPRRTRQQSTTLSSRPTVNAVDSIEDDLEEVML